MAIDYSELLTTEQKKEILQQRIVQIASEAFQLQLNVKIIDNEEQKKTIEETLVSLEKAIKVHKEELAKVTE